MVIKNEINEVKSIKSWLYEMSIKSVKVICLYPDWWRKKTEDTNNQYQKYRTGYHHRSYRM